METVSLFEEILKWSSEKLSADAQILPSDESLTTQFSKIEKLTGEKLPLDFRSLYSTYNGETTEGYGSFLQLYFMSLDGIIDQLEFYVKLIKPKERFIADPEKSNEVINTIITHLKESIPAKKSLGLFTKKWLSVKITLSPGSFSGIYIHYSPDKRESINPISGYDVFIDLCRQLYLIEQEHYNWDEIEIILQHNGDFKIERLDYDLNDPANFSVFPKDTIRKIYFHHKWIPIFEDGGGNYIGIDLDPDIKGAKGQVIIFVRDEHNMAVIANSLTDFLKFTLTTTKEKPDTFFADVHIHEIFKRLVNVSYN